ncbi:MAG: PAS domain S-box protein [Syntrophus sp. (in: bacteria)]
MINGLNARQLVHAKQAVRGIETFFDEHINILQNYSKNEHIINFDESGKRLMRQFLLSHGSEISIIVREDSQGRILYSEPYNARVIGQQSAKMGDFLKAKSTNQITVSDVFTNLRGFQSIIIHAPVLKNGHFNGTIALLVSFEYITKKYIDDIRIGKEGYAWVISRNGIELSCPVPGHVGNSVFDNCREFPDILAMAKKMTKGEQGATTYMFDRIRGYTVSKTIKHAVFMPIRLGDTFWSIVIATPEDEVTGALNKFRDRLLLIASFLIIAIGFILYILIKTKIIVKEVEQRRKTEEELRESEATMRAILNATAEALSVIDCKGKILTVNNAFAIRFQKTPDDLLGQSIYDLINPELAELRRVQVSDVILSRKPVYFEDQRGDRHIEHSLYPIIESAGQINKIAIYARDMTERKQAEIELRRSEEKFSAFFRSAPIPMAISTIKGGYYLDVNDAFLDRFGYSGDEVVGKSSIELGILTSEVREFIMSKLVDAGEVKNIEVDVHTKDRRRLTGMFNAELISVAEEQYWLTTFVDITERKRAESRILRQNNAFKGINRIFQEALSLNTEEDLGGTCLDVAEEITESKIGFIGEIGLDGYLHDIAISNPGWEACEMIDTTGHRKPPGNFNIHGIYGRVLKDGKGFFTNNTASHPDQIGLPPGHPPLTAFLGVPLINNGRTIGMIAVGNRNGGYTGEEQEMLETLAPAIVEAFQRKRTEEALKKSEEGFRAIFEHSTVGKSLTAPDGKLLQINKSFANMLGYTIEEVRQINFAQITHPDDLAESQECVRILLTGEQATYRFEKRYIHKNGNIVWADVSTTLLHGEQGTPPRLITSIVDITERKRAEEESHLFAERLQRAEKMEALGTLAGGVAHDLNNVLGIVVGYAEMLLDEIDESSPLREDVMKIMEGGNRSAAIVQDLLTLARRGVQTQKVINLNDTIRGYQKTPEFEALFSLNRLIKLKTDLETDLLNIMGSPVHLGKTFINLVTNAVESMPSGGVLTITTGNQSLDKPIHGYDAVNEGDYVVLSIADTGEGIFDHDIKHIFEPFYTKKVMGRSGTGLGLAVVWGTVKDHNGYINVQSEVGKGTTFKLYFPVRREEIAKIDTAIPLSEYIGKDESILVIDDIKEQRELAAKMLGKLNYRVKSVSSGEEAVQYLGTEKADLIVLDMIMDPGMDGLDTYKAIIEIHPKQKAIIVSGFSETDRVIEAKTLGAGDYLRKPYVQEKLGLAVRKELNRK